jgi:hypothetical protein
VRVAVALVTGQAALCAVIGWVTFGPSAAKPDAANAKPLNTQIQLAPMPTLPAGVPPAPPGPAASPVPSSPRASRSSRPVVTRTTTKPAADKHRPVIATGQTPPEPPPASPNPGLAAPSPPAPSGVQSPVVVGRPCDPDGAKGLTLDLIELVCVLDRDGDLVWQIN